MAHAELRPTTPGSQIMAMAALLRQFTVKDVEAFPHDGNRYEVLNGVLLVTPQAGVPHQSVATRLVVAIGAGLKGEPDVEMWAPGAIQLRPTTHVEPDILIGRMPAVASWGAIRDYWLAVEVSGTSSRMYDREYKRDAYLQLGVKEV